MNTNVSRIFTGSLFVLFIAVLLMAILAGTNVYRDLHRMSNLAESQRMTSTLIANDIRSNDQINAVGRAQVKDDGTAVVAYAQNGSLSASASEGSVQGTIADSDVLVLRETLPSGNYETRIYLSNGNIVEEYAVEGSPYGPATATVIAPSDTFSFSYTNGVLTIQTDSGETRVAIRADGRGNE